MRVLAIGECMAELAPMVAQGSAAGSYQMGFAGDTYNTLWYLAQLSSDVTVSYFTAVGDDAISAQMLETFGQGGIDSRFVQVISGKSVGLYLISLDNGERSFSYWRSASAAKQLAKNKDALKDAMDQSDLIYFSGITLAILGQDGRDTLLNEARAARSAGKRIVFDPNLRPHLWDSPSIMTDNIMQAAAVADIALPSFDDEASWFKDANPVETLRRYAQAGVETVIVKNGAYPILCQTGDAYDTFDVPPLASIVDTTAAGDSFNAGILSGLATHAPLSQSIPLACKLARHVVQGRGALVPIEQSLISQFTTQPHRQTT